MICVKKANDIIKKLQAAHEGQAVAIRKKPVYGQISAEMDVEYQDACARQALFSSAVLRGRRKAAENPPTKEELEAEITAVR